MYYNYSMTLCSTLQLRNKFTLNVVCIIALIIICLQEEKGQKAFAVMVF